MPGGGRAARIPQAFPFSGPPCVATIDGYPENELSCRVVPGHGPRVAAARRFLSGLGEKLGKMIILLSKRGSKSPARKSKWFIDGPRGLHFVSPTETAGRRARLVCTDRKTGTPSNGDPRFLLRSSPEPAARRAAATNASRFVAVSVKMNPFHVAWRPRRRGHVIYPARIKRSVISGPGETRIPRRFAGNEPVAQFRPSSSPR